MLQSVRGDGISLRLASAEHRKDRQLVSMAVNQHGGALKFAAKNLQKDDSLKRLSTRKLWAAARKKSRFPNLSVNKIIPPEQIRMEEEISALEEELEKRMKGERAKDARWHGKRAHLDDPDTGPEAVREVQILQTKMPKLFCIKFLFEACKF